jgi:hypothetical protein
MIKTTINTHGRPRVRSPELQARAVELYFTRLLDRLKREYENQPEDVKDLLKGRKAIIRVIA